MAADRKTSLFPSVQERGELKGENKHNIEPAFVHPSDSPSHHTKTGVSRGWNYVRQHEHCTQVSTAKDKGTQGDLANRKGPNQSVWVCLSHRGQASLFPNLCPPIQISQLWTLTSDSTKRQAPATEGAWSIAWTWKPSETDLHMHWRVAKPLQTFIFQLGWNELLFCSPNEPRILSTGPGICATAIWDIQNTNKLFLSISHVLVKNPPEGSRHLPVLLAWNLHESMVRKWPC